MPRPVKKNETPGVHGNAPVKSPVGDSIIVYADNAVWNETKGKFTLPEDVVRKN